MARKTFKKIITSDELIANINPENKKIMERFLRDKNIRSSDTTIKGYESDLNIFMVWNLLNNENKHFVEIKKLELSEFFCYAIDEMKWGSSRFSRMRSCLSSFSAFIEKYYDEDFPTFRNNINKVVESIPKNLVREKSIFSEEQINELLISLVDKGNFDIACWVALAISSGARFSELFRITTDLIDRNQTAFDGIFIELTKKIKTKGRGRQGKLLTKYIIKDLFLPFYDQWMIKRQEIMTANNKDHNSIFIKRDGSAAADSTVRSWILYIEEYFRQPFYPHSLRHYTNTMLLKLGLPPQLIKEIFGWESVEMVELYSDIDVKDRKWNELENLKSHLGKANNIQD